MTIAFPDRLSDADRGQPHQTGAVADLHHLADAHFACAEAKKRRNTEEITATGERLRHAVDAARDAGSSWGQIADALGTRRGNAYAQFRKRPAR